MIYLDTSVLLAELLSEDTHPKEGFWRNPLVSSRLVECEAWNRIHARGLGSTHGEALRLLLGRVALLELVPPVLARALDPFPAPIRTLDALHLASAVFLKDRDPKLVLATYDRTQAAVASALGIRVLRP